MSRLKDLKKRLNKLVNKAIRLENVQDLLYKEYINSPNHFQQRNSKTGKLNGVKFKNLNTRLIKCFFGFEALTPDERYRRLKKLQVHPRIILGVPVVNLIKHLDLFDEINKQREIILMESYDIINNMINSKSRYDMFVEREDISQWAWTVAWEATLQYDSKRGDWEKYLVYTLNRSLYKDIAENSRLISLPRWLLSRWSPVSRAYKENPDNVIELANRKANSSIAKKKEYTEQEVHDLDRVINASYQNIDTMDLYMKYEPSFSIDTNMLRSQILEEGKRLLSDHEFRYLVLKLEGNRRVDILEKIKEYDPKFTISQLNKCHSQLMQKLKQSERLSKIMSFIKEEEV